MPKYIVTHRILRMEYLGIDVEAPDKETAIKKASEIIDENYTTADYEPGDTIDDDDDVYFVEELTS